MLISLFSLTHSKEKAVQAHLVEIGKIRSKPLSEQQAGHAPAGGARIRRPELTRAHLQEARVEAAGRTIAREGCGGERPLGLGAKPCVHGPSSISVDASLDWNLDLTATQLWS